MRYYSDFWLTGGILSLAWADRSDLPEPVTPDDAADPLESLDMQAWMALPVAVQQAMIAAYAGLPRSWDQIHRNSRP